MQEPERSAVKVREAHTALIKELAAILDWKKNNQNSPATVMITAAQIVAAISAHVTTLGRKMAKFLDEFQEGHFGDEFNQLLPGVARDICSECPLNRWRPISCSMPRENTLVLEFVASQED